MFAAKAQRKPDTIYQILNTRFILLSRQKFNRKLNKKSSIAGLVADILYDIIDNYGESEDIY
jgi:hypothetical protein